MKKRLSKLLLSLIMVMMMAFTIMPTSVCAAENTATDWSQVQDLIDNAAENDVIDISALRLTTANVTLSITKNITIKCEPTDQSFYLVYIKNLYFNIQNNAILKLENIAIESTNLNQSMISGTGNVIISKSVLQPSTAYGTTTVYNPPATIDVTGDVSIMTDADLFSCVVAGASIIERNSGDSGKAGAAIRAANVTINGGNIQGGASFESNCDSGDAIIASGNVTINSKAEVQAGSIGENAGNTTVGLPIRFTENPDVQRVLFVQNAYVFGSNSNSNGNAAPYIVKMSAKDIAIIDNSKIGWYTTIPVFSDGFFYITNPVSTWGTLDNATEVYRLTATNATLTGTKVVAIGENITHYAQKDATITIQADTPVTGKQFKEWTVVSGDITLANTKNATTTFLMSDETVEVTATYEDIPPHIHTPLEMWSKDELNHWHECIANDGEKLNLAPHIESNWIIDKEATSTKKGNKHKECTVCGQILESVEIPTLETTPEYLYIEGANSQWSENSNSGLKVIVNGDFNKFIGVSINEKLIAPSNYIAQSGSTVVTLNPDYLNTLEAGTYHLAVIYTDGKADTTFTIHGMIKTDTSDKTDTENAAPNTGDTISITLLMSYLILSSLVITAVLKKKNSY